MIGKLLKKFTMDTGISQKEVAEKLQYSPQRVNNYYRDIAEAPHEFLEKFRLVFNVDLKAQLDKEKKGLISGGSYNPIPVYDLDLKPIKELDFFNHSELVSYYIDVPMFNDCSAGVKVTGNSMAPTFKPSDIVLLKRVTNFDTLPLGEYYLIVTDEQTYIRCLRTNAGDKKSYSAKVENPDYDDLILKKTDIRYLFQVKGKIKRF